MFEGSPLFSSPRNSKRLKPIGYCIYCGATGEGAGLSVEHIIPLGLGGSVLLPEASCEKCSKITGAFEGKVLQNNFIQIRTHLGLRTRRKKSRPTHFSITAHEDRGKISHSVPLDQHPIVLMLPKMPAAGYLIGRPRWVRAAWVMLTIVLNPEEAKRRFDAISPNKLLSVDIEFFMDEFMRMLAKIAHGFAASQIGLENIDAFLPDIILGERNDLLPHLIGGGEPLRANPADQAAHGLEFMVCDLTGAIEAKDILIVRIQLFANFRAPIYEIIVGKVKISREEQEKLGFPKPSLLNIRRFPLQDCRSPQGRPPKLSTKLYPTLSKILF